MSEHSSGPGRDGEDREPEPVDEDAAWAAIVAGYGEQPVDPVGMKPWPSAEDPRSPSERGVPGDGGALPVREPDGAGRPPGGRGPAGAGDDGRDDGTARDDGERDGPDPRGDRDGHISSPRPLGSSVTVHGVGIFPRDGGPAEPSGDEPDDEDHFVPPEPPPLPPADTTAKFAWLAVLGGPLLLLLTVLLRWDMTWWIGTLGLGGFLGGFATLVMRMKDDDEEGDDPGRGAVV